MASFASLPKPQEPLTRNQGSNGFILNTWYLALVQLITNVAGAVIGPSSSVDGQIALFDGTSGQLLKAATGTGYVRTDAGVYSTPTHAATSVLGRSVNSTGDMADIAATANGTVLTRQSNALVFATPDQLGGYWSLVTNGDPTVPELVFDSNGDVVSVWVPV